MESTRTRGRKFHSLDAGRGIAAMAVVFHHACGVPVLLSGATPLRDPFFGLGLGVAYFFVLSGAVIFLAHRKDLGVPASARSYIVKRIRRIYPMFWLAWLTWIIAVVRQRPPYRLLVETALLLRIFHMDPGTIPVAWTLFHEILFYLLFLVAILNRRIGMVFLGAWWIAGLLLIHNGPPTFAADLSPLQSLFALGMLAGWLIETRRTVPQPAVALVLGGVGLAGTVVRCGMRGDCSEPDYLLAGVAAFLIIWAAAGLEAQGRFNVPAPLRFLGAASYSIYLFHLPVIFLAGRAFTRMQRHYPLPAALWAVLLFLLGSAGGCAVHVWIERPLMRWLTLETARLEC